MVPRPKVAQITAQMFSCAASGRNELDPAVASAVRFGGWGPYLAGPAAGPIAAAAHFLSFHRFHVVASRIADGFACRALSCRGNTTRTPT